MTLTDVWPVRGIELRHRGLELRPMTEADLPGIVERLPDDLEMDPTLPRYGARDAGAARAAALVQGYWRSMGGWSPQDWALPFVVRLDGEVVGAQVLEGPADYGEQRVVDSSSWLLQERRGQGLGTLMRAAVLELAFGHLGAVAAISSAYVENAASLGVSRRLGYADTHTSVLEHNGRQLQHLRLERDTWRESGRGRAVTVSGVAPALPWFGLGDERD
ncbi:MAG TPA: GNAT family N-acetyltransferase, partial [Intrasporangium sp.]|nr:GNAT family N-acetyltransferase [Intrasporangium sp.]